MTKRISDHDRELVMGAGNAKAFRDRFPGIARAAGNKVTTLGNHVHLCGYDAGTDTYLLSFPTKQDWKDPSRLDLIVQSAEELMVYINTTDWTDVYLCAPGVGLGGLSWSVVKNAIAPILDERVIITFLPKKR